jgi:hypothetical protein
MKPKSRQYALSILIGLFLVLILSSSFFHNHSPTFQEPFTCSVILFQTVLSTAIISLLLFELSRLDKSEFIIFYKFLYLPQQNHFRKLSNRAPPEDLY